MLQEVNEKEAAFTKPTYTYNIVPSPFISSYMHHQSPLQGEFRSNYVATESAIISTNKTKVETLLASRTKLGGSR